MIKKIISICFLFFSLILLHAAAYAQKNISGSIRDTLNNPITNASMILRYVHNNVPQTKYQLVNQEGKYTISYDENYSNIQLQCIAMGFHSQTIVVEKGKEVYDFTLKTAEILLEPVNIVAKQPVKTKGDTVTFSADAYSKKNEGTVEDLLKKLPGMDVDKDGNIKYNGRNIEKILVEGDDLFDKDFKMLSKNLSADLIDKIQAIDNYNDNKLLADLSKTDKQVLNLQLKKDKLLNVNGNANLNGGFPKGKFDNRLNMLTISPALKGIALGAMNNVGVNSFSLLSATQDQRKRSVDGSITAQANTKIADIPLLYYNGIDLNRNNFNDAKIGSANFMLKPFKSLEIKTMAYWMTDKNVQQQNNNINYLVNGANAIRFDENNHLTKQQSFQSYMLDISYKPKDDQQIKYTAKFGRNVVDLLSNPSSIIGNIQQNLNELNTNAEQRIRYTNRLNKNLALDGEVLYNFNKSPQSLVISPSNYLGVLNFNSSIENTIYQNSDSPISQFSVLTRLLGRVGKHGFNLNVGYNNIGKEFHAFLYSDQKPGAENLGGKYSNLIENVYSDIVYDWEINSKMSLTLNSNYTIEQFDLDNSDQFKINEKYNYFQNKANLTYKTEKSGSIAFQYSSKLSLPLVSDIVPNYWLSNYRTLVKGSGQFLKRKGHTFSINYNIADFYRKRMLLYTGFVYDTNPLNYFTSQEVTPLNQILNKKPLLNNDANYIAYGRLEKFIFPIRGNLTFDINTIWATIPSEINNMENMTHMNISSLKLGYKSGWEGWASMVMSSALRLNRQSKNNNEQRVSSTKSFENRLNLYLIPDERFNFEFSAEQYFLPANDKFKSLLFLDAKAKYLLKNNKWSLTFSALNILNNKSLSFDKIGQDQFSTQTYNLVPNIFMLSVYHRFTL